MRRAPAFTIVELLVVVTIIVVLLALLAPALDKAIYQAELTVCGARQHAIINSVTARAIDYQRKYPDRSAMSVPHQLQHLTNGDTRPVMKEYVGNLNAMLIDPFNDPVDLETPNTAHVYGNYWLFFGMRVGGSDGGPGMNRFGDGWVWRGGKYSIMTADRSVVRQDQSFQYSTHPDDDGVLYHRVLNGGVDDSFVVASEWDARTINRGLQDFNFGYEDGSVLRFDRVQRTTSPSSEQTDPRMVLIPQSLGSGSRNEVGIVPHN